MEMTSMAENLHDIGCETDAIESAFRLMISPRAMARTRFCNPLPINSSCMTVAEGINQLSHHLDTAENPASLVVIDGPGDPLATPDFALKAITIIRSRFPHLQIGLSTLGIGSRDLAPELGRAGLDTLEMTVNSTRAEVLEKLYAWIRPGRKTMRLSEAALLLVSEQKNGIPALCFNEISVRIKTTLYPGHNLDQAEKISREMMEMGASGIALASYCAHRDAEVHLDPVTPRQMSMAAGQVSKYLPVVQAFSAHFISQVQTAEQPLPKPTRDRPFAAVASFSGMEVDMHLGQAYRFLIYGPREDGLVCLLESRDAPEPGSGPDRWEKLAELLHDCFTVLVSNAGQTPRDVLGDSGVNLLITTDDIEGLVDRLYGGGKKGK